ncbi:hypothetical protein IT570_03850 [Candidatus Sumerlaeota bacterium]|nr:hypothetical protein [Candidatus Sumerlaeota bacterium]
MIENNANSSESGASTLTGLAEAVVVQIDGNSLSALSGRNENGIIYIDALEHLELDEMVEVTKRLHHPVFMDTYFRCFAEKETISRVLGHFFRDPIFKRPAVALLSPEKALVGELNGPPTERSKKGRQAKLIQQLLPINPYDYPCAIRMEEHASQDGRHSVTRVTRVRLADLLPLNKSVASQASSYHGAVIGLHAAANVLNHLAKQGTGGAVTLCDVGKLRTLYSTVFPDGRILHNAIPVGLAGDHLNSVRSYTPTIEHLVKLDKALGTLLLSPETSTTFPGESSKSGAPGSPQVDCTRFTSQIARYHLRSVEAHLSTGPNHSTADDANQNVHFIGGRASRLPGMRAFVEAVIGASLRRLDRRPIPGIALAPGIKWSDVGDNALLLGGFLEVVKPDGLLISTGESEFHTVSPNAQQACSVNALCESTLYVFEQKLDVLSA